MESHRLMTQLLVLTCCIVMALARLATSLQDEDVSMPDALYNGEMDVKRNSQEDISKLLLKHLRFRQLADNGVPMSEYVPHNGEKGKRQEQRMLVNNLAALLSGLRDRQSDSSMRMPSLRFG